MRRLFTDTSSTTNGFPPTQGTWDFLQDSHKELFSEFIKERLGSYSITEIYLLRGCVSSISGLNTDFTEGAVFFNGEVYLCPAQTIVTPTGSDVIICNILETPYTTNADPVQYSGGGTPVNCHLIRTLQFASGATGTGTMGGKDFDDIVQIGAWVTAPTSYTTGPSVLNPDPDYIGMTSGGGASITAVAYNSYKIIDNTLIWDLDTFNFSSTGVTTFGIALPKSGIKNIGGRQVPVNMDGNLVWASLSIGGKYLYFQAGALTNVRLSFQLICEIEHILE